MHHESHQTKIQALFEVPLFTHGMSIESREVHKMRHIFLHSPASMMQHQKLYFPFIFNTFKKINLQKFFPKSHLADLLSLKGYHSVCAPPSVLCLPNQHESKEHQLLLLSIVDHSKDIFVFVDLVICLIKRSLLSQPETRRDHDPKRK